MKKIILSTLALVAVSMLSSCGEDKLDIAQKGVTPTENFYKTDADAEAALAAAYAQFATYVPGRGQAFINTPFKTMLNMPGDDVFAAGSNFGDNDHMGSLNEFRFDSGHDTTSQFYTGLFLANYACNLVIDNFKEGIVNPTNDGPRSPSAVSKQCVAEARVLRALIYFYLTALWDTPPFIDHVIAASELPVNCDVMETPMSHDDLMRWVASECESAVTDLTSRNGKTDKDGAVRVTKDFAYALAGKAYLFVKDYTAAKTALKKVIDSNNYDLVPGENYWQNFHIEGDCNEEKVFEINIEYNSGIGAWGGINQRSSWMEANIWSWRADHFQAVPHSVYCGGADGWGGLGVPQWFGDEFFENDGHSPRFDATLKHIDDVVYNMTYQDSTLTQMPLEEKKKSTKIGIKDPNDGLYGESFWLPFKQLVKAEDCNANYGNNVRLNNHVIMRYAEVLLLYAEACLQTNDQAGALESINKIQKRAGSKTISASVDMDVLKKEKSYELWLEGCRFLDLVRWGDTSRAEKAGSDVPKLYDKLHKAPESGKTVTWEHGTEADSRFYTISSHEAMDRGFKCGFVKGKHEHLPFPMTVMEKNPNLRQNLGW
ncbi:MAG: RagB/SusD family nutrient uptake outer membrane protein [Bacteroidales bacterium]|nr:RagB/SusD family nutrient uptake outer membrane protein [Bacteroidales bacterium]